ncbi:MAG: cytochrome C [Chloroflexi bacterium]|nr:cytochrome C [Chloroflexota bacterium]
MKRILRHQRHIFTFCFGAGLALVIIALWPDSSSQPTFKHPVVEAQDGGSSNPTAKQPTGNNAYCAVCHSQEGRTVALADGTSLDLHVTPDAVADSVHGTSNSQETLGCVDCHGESAFPHVEARPESSREFTIKMSQVCTDCHVDEAQANADGVHAHGLANGNLRAAVCVDCHGAHDVQHIKDQPQLAAETCGTCHTSIFDEYKQSIHGEALLVNGDTNAPTCITCHGVHGISTPTTAQFRNRSPELCASCHADKKLMAKYDISTSVFDTYLNEFHGTTVALFEQEDPNAASNKAVCYDCHGVHNITPANNSKSQVAKQNLLATCQQCHPDASSDFPDAWVGHFEPSRTQHPLVYVVDLFYKILIPGVLSGFVFLVATDIFARTKHVGGRKKSAPPPKEGHTESAKPEKEG